MDFLQLEYFLAVARLGNMTLAASSLNVSQSSVSRSISRLENSLGVPLFERTGRGIALNDYGRIFYSRAEASMREIRDGEQALKELRDQQVGRIAISTTAPRQINPLMTQYLQEEPSVLFRQKRISDLNDIKFNLDNGTLDYALTYTPLPDLEYQWTPLIRERFYALVSRDHPLSHAQSIDLSTLAGERILLNGTDSPDFIEEQCLQSGFSPLFAFIGEEYEVLGPMVEMGLGISFISTLSLYDMRKSLSLEHLSRVSLIQIQNDSLSRTLGVLFKKHSYRSPVAKNFYKKLTAYFKLIDFELNNIC